MYYVKDTRGCVVVYLFFNCRSHSFNRTYYSPISMIPLSLSIIICIFQLRNEQFFLMNIAFSFCICYNCLRQKKLMSNRTNESPARLRLAGDSSLCYGEHPLCCCCLFIFVQPFANVVGNYTCCDRDNQRS